MGLLMVVLKGTEVGMVLLSLLLRLLDPNEEITSGSWGCFLIWLVKEGETNIDCPPPPLKSSSPAPSRATVMESDRKGIEHKEAALSMPKQVEG